MTLIEAAKQALEALEQTHKSTTKCISDFFDDWKYDEVDYLHKRFDSSDANVISAIAVLSQAIEQAEKVEPVAWLPSAEWTPCVKLPVTVHVRKQREGETHVSTREGITPIKPDDLIMRGVSGEEYPIGREIFEKTYRIGEHPAPAVPEGYTWEQVFRAANIAKSDCKNVTGMHKKIDLYVNATQIAHDVCGTDIAPAVPECTWELDNTDCFYHTSCDNSFVLNEGTPAENDMKFCPYCCGMIKVEMNLPWEGQE